jgi:hypothetical protein
VDRQSGELPGDPPPRYPYYVTDDNALKVPRCSWDDVKERNRAMQLMREGRPVVLKGTGLVGRMGSRYPADDRPGLLGTWSFDRLTQVGGRDARKWRCMTSPSGSGTFMPPNQDSNLFGSHYHVRRPETELMRCSLKEFVQCARAWTERAIYLQDEVATLEAGGEGGDAAARAGGASTAGAPIPVAGGAGVGRDVVAGLDWQWLNGLRRAQRFGPVRSVVVGAGSAGSLLPAHHPTMTHIASSAAYDATAADASDPGAAAAAAAAAALTNSTAYESLQCQVVGRRRVLLIPPEHSYKGMYPFPVAHPYDGYSMVDLDEADYSKFPLVAKVRGEAAVLDPGDVLFVPDAWWRHEQGLSAEHAAVELRMSTGGRARSAGASVLAVGRRVEDRVTREEGPRDARHWARVIAEAEEADWVDLGTVAGQRRVDMAQMVRDEVDHGLVAAESKAGAPGPGSGAGVRVALATGAVHRRRVRRGRWQPFLRQLIDGRMEPTPWLNANFKDPLFIAEAEAATRAAAKAAAIADGTGGSGGGGGGGGDLVHVAVDAGAVVAAGGSVALPGGGFLTAQAKILPDDRSEGERRFPEFFVEKLRRDGYDTKHTPMSVLNPEHPEFIGNKGTK